MTDNFQNDVAAVQRVDAVPRILEIVCRMTGMGFAAVARVTEDRWIACAVCDSIDFGLQPGGELDISTTICNETQQSRLPIVIDHVSQNSDYCDHLAAAKYRIESCVSVPIILSDGSFFGTLCAIDPKPASVNTPETIGMFGLFAELIAAQLEAAATVAASNALLLDERNASELREQFIAVLGHDLRNPLAAIASGVRLLQRIGGDEKSAMILDQMQNSVVRMSRLIDNVLDFARGRLGGGFVLERSSEPLEPVLRQVIAEFVTSHPDRTIEAAVSIDCPLSVDHVRVSQVLSNLISNALRYGTPGTPVRVRAHTNARSFELEVANVCEPIPPEKVGRLFRPFTRAEGPADAQSLGLGLYIASEITKAHGGWIDVTSTMEETTFTARMPNAGHIEDSAA